MVQLSHPYMTTAKAIALTIRTFVSKVMSLLFIMLSRFAIAFLPRSKHLNFMAAITNCSDFGAPQNKVSQCFHCFPIYLLCSDGTGCHDLKFFECWVLSQLFHSPLSHKRTLKCVRNMIQQIQELKWDSNIFFPGKTLREDGPRWVWWLSDVGT